LNHAVEAFGASSAHITEITRGLEEDDREFYHSFVTWEEDVVGTKTVKFLYNFAILVG
jgi:S-adenosylmethionine decarboxylase